LSRLPSSSSNDTTLSYHVPSCRLQLLREGHLGWMRNAHYRGSFGCAGKRSLSQLAKGLFGSVFEGWGAKVVISNRKEGKKGGRIFFDFLSLTSVWPFRWWMTAQNTRLHETKIIIMLVGVSRETCGIISWKIQ